MPGAVEILGEDQTGGSCQPAGQSLAEDRSQVVVLPERSLAVEVVPH